MADNQNDKSKTSDEQELLRAVLSSPAVGMPHHADDETRKTYLDRRMQQAEAYGQFVADGPIYWPGTGILVFNQGAAVPIEHVEKWDLEVAGLVTRVATPRLARVGRRFDNDVAEKGAELGEVDAPGGDDGNTGGAADAPSRPTKSTTAAKK